MVLNSGREWDTGYCYAFFKLRKMAVIFCWGTLAGKTFSAIMQLSISSSDWLPVHTHLSRRVISFQPGDSSQATQALEDMFDILGFEAMDRYYKSLEKRHCENLREGFATALGAWKEKFSEEFGQASLAQRTIRDFGWI